MTVTKTKGVIAGTSPTWSVSATGFVTQSGTVDNIQADTTLPVYLLGSLGGLKKLIDARASTWFVTQTGDLYGCGNNNKGQQGSGDTTNVTTFTKRAENVKDIVTEVYGEQLWYITNDGDLYGCGKNGNGQQGSGNATDVTTFTKRASNVKKVACSGTTTWYIDDNNDLYGCGSSYYGQQGSGNTTGVKTFTKRAENVKDVCIDYWGDVTWYITNSGDLYGCGYNSNGNQGDGTTTNVTIFTKRAENVKDIYVYNNVTWYIDNDGDLYGCGYNGSGQQGSGNTTDVTTFTKRAENVKCLYPYVERATWYLTNDGDLYGCGSGDSGKQGSGNTSNVTTFTKRASNVKKFIAPQNQTEYLTNDGDLYMCGSSYYGQQGSENTTNVTRFTKRASNVKDIIDVGVNGKNLMYERMRTVTWYITNDGDLYGCGSNEYGQQGKGSSTGQSSDIVNTFTKRASNVKEAYASDITTWYVNVNGDLYGCGNNNKGQQGSGNTTNVTSFTQRENVGFDNTATLTISPTPADATVTIDGEAVSTKDIRKGLTATYTVSKTGYVTQTGTTDHLYADTTLTIELESE